MNPLLSAVLRVTLFALGLAATCLPRRLELALGRALGRVFFYLDFSRKRVARENLARCLPERSLSEREALLRRNYEHYGILTFELAHMFSPIPGHYRRYTEKNAVVEGFDVYERLNALGKGTIAVTGHFANWEMMSICGIRGINVMVTGRRVKPEWLNTIVVSARAGNNTRTASGKRILPELLRWIKDGNTSTFILDQYAAPPAGLPARFFGATVDTQGVVGLVAQRTGAPIFMAFQRRGEDGRIHVVFEEITLSDAQREDPAAATQVLASRMEAWLRRHPDQWLWVHRRFKNAVWPTAQPV